MWNDRLYSDGDGTTWVERREFHGGNGRGAWGRVADASALDEMLSTQVEPARATRSTVKTPAVTPVLEPGSTFAGTSDAGLRGWGTALLAIPVVGLALAVWRRRSSSARAVSGR